MLWGMVPVEFLNCAVFNACKVEHKMNVWGYSVQSVKSSVISNACKVYSSASLAKKKKKN